MEKEKAKQLLVRQVDASTGLGRVDSSSPVFTKWQRDTLIVIEKVFGENSRHSNDFESIDYSLSFSYDGMPDNAWVVACEEGLETARAILQSMVGEIDEFGTASKKDGDIELGQPRSNKLIFVSHSSVDKEIADALLDMLCTALHLRLSDFVCTSVDGAKLRGGEHTGEVLRQAIQDVPAFLSILTQQAVTSTYVLFELGARWGCAKPHIPLLARGSRAEILKEPLKATNALLLSKEEDVLQLVEDLASVLNRTAEPPNSFVRKVRTVVALSSNPPQPLKASARRRTHQRADNAHKEAEVAARDPRRVEAAAEQLLRHLADLGDIVIDPQHDADTFGMHRVRMEKYINDLLRAGLMRETAANFGSRLFHITMQGKQYLLDYKLV